MAAGIQVSGAESAASGKVLSREALALVEELHRKLAPTRQKLLAARAARQLQFDQGHLPTFLEETRKVREGSWQVASCPADLQKRRVEITGPVERKMMINALNSGAQMFMADFEDSLSPTWTNIVDGQQNLYDAVRRTISFSNPDGKQYKLNEKIATLIVRPRGWHLNEKHVSVDGTQVSASLFDFGLHFFHNAAELLKRGSGPYYYLPKQESHLEARLWNDAFLIAQERLGIPRGSIRATCLIETMPAAFEMDEFLYELREHASGHNAGRWDYIFSLIKKLRNRKDLILPDRGQITMTTPFMRAYTELLVQTCHKRGAHAMGGMAPFIPSRKNPEINEAALAKVRADKEREAKDGFDGTWVAHPDLVTTAMEVFDRVLGDKPHQKDKTRPEVHVQASQLVDTRLPDGTITEAGVRNNISVAIQYISGWLGGNGAVAINNLMEDAATAEISRAQLWQWITNGARLEDGRVFDKALYEKIRTEEVVKLGHGGHNDAAVKLLDRLATGEFLDFLTLPAYEQLE
jgi:malate synthase